MPILQQLIVRASPTQFNQYKAKSE